MAAFPQTPVPSAPPSTPLPEPLTLPALQRYVARIVAERGFTGELDRVFILWVEELGELAEESARRAVRPGPAPPLNLGGAERAASAPPVSQGLAFELADVTLYLADLANGLGVDLGAALAGTERPAATERTAAAERPAAAEPAAAPHAAGALDPERASLGAWQAWVAEAQVAEAQVAGAQRDAGAAWLELIEAAGRLARQLRARWAGKAGTGAGGGAGAALGNALRATLSLAVEYSVDLSAALREKEQVNRGRTWTD
jgi:NTP pyrophosphatase (non-canonical NTP hydrolase)